MEVEGSWEEMAEEGLWWEEVVVEVMGHWYRDHFGSILHSSQDRFHNTRERGREREVNQIK